jgi:hypothetical protein
MRSAILAVALAFVALLLALTVHAVAQSGPDVLTLLSLVVLLLLGVGIVGALRDPPRP